MTIFDSTKKKKNKNIRESHINGLINGSVEFCPENHNKTEIELFRAFFA